MDGKMKIFLLFVVIALANCGGRSGGRRTVRVPAITYEKVGSGQCGTFNNPKWIDTGKIISETNRGEQGVSLAACQQKCTEHAQCRFVTLHLACYLWSALECNAGPPVITNMIKLGTYVKKVAARCPHFFTGKHGKGTSDKEIGSVNSIHECISKCRLQNGNGISLEEDKMPSKCWCISKMTSIVSSKGWKTCLMEESYTLHQSGRCASWDNPNWIDTGSIKSQDHRGERGVSFKDCQQKCDAHSQCRFATWEDGGGHWCFLWSGSECSAVQLHMFNTYAKVVLAKASVDRPLLLAKATQSSTYKGAGAGRAIDGNKDTKFSRNSCTHTQRSTNPELIVELKTINVVNEVRIWNRKDYSDRLNNAYVSVLNNVGKWRSCGSVGTMKNIEESFVNCNGVIGSKVRVKIYGKKKILTICELEVFGRISSTVNNAFEKIGDGRCAPWNHVNWIKHKLSENRNDPGIKGKTEQWCRETCGGIEECNFVIYTPLAKKWCYMWKGAVCAPQKYGDYKTYKKQKPTTKQCASRESSQPCNEIANRKSCLTSTDSRGGFQGQACVWCPNGACTSANENRCEPKTWLKDQGVSDFEECLSEINISGTFRILKNKRCKDDSGKKYGDVSKCIQNDGKTKGFVCNGKEDKSDGTNCKQCSVIKECTEFIRDGTASIYQNRPVTLRVGSGGEVFPDKGFKITKFNELLPERRTSNKEEETAFQKECLLICQGSDKCDFISIEKGDKKMTCYRADDHWDVNKHGDFDGTEAKGQIYQVCPGGSKFCPSRIYKGSCQGDSDCTNQGSMLCGSPYSCPDQDGRCCISKDEPSYKRITTEGKNYCASSRQDQCSEGEGVCSADTNCRGDLKCGWANCAYISPAHLSKGENRCCYKPPASSRCSAVRKIENLKLAVNACNCTAQKPCLDGEGGCKNDTACAKNHICDKTCPWNPFEKCCNKMVAKSALRCLGEELCCTEMKRCEKGTGTCTSHNQCETGLLCGNYEDNSVDCHSSVNRRKKTRCCRAITSQHKDRCMIDKKTSICKDKAGQPATGFCGQCGQNMACCQKSSTRLGGDSSNAKLECTVGNKGCDNYHCCSEVDVNVQKGIIGEFGKLQECTGNCMCTGMEVTYHLDAFDEAFSKNVKDKYGIVGVKMICNGKPLESDDAEMGYDHLKTWTKKMVCPQGENIISFNTVHLNNQGHKDDMGLIGVNIECSKGSEIRSFTGVSKTKYFTIKEKDTWKKCDKITDTGCKCDGGIVMGLRTKYQKNTNKDDNYGVTDLEKSCRKINSCAILRKESHKKTHDDINIVKACAIQCAASGMKFMNISFNTCKCLPPQASSQEYELIKCPSSCHGCIFVNIATAKPACVKQIGQISIPKEINTLNRSCLDQCLLKYNCNGFKASESTSTCSLLQNEPAKNGCNKESYMEMVGFQIYGHFLEWGAWSKCSTTCGLGKKVRMRQCDRVSGVKCDSLDLSETRDCEVPNTNCKPRRTCNAAQVQKLDEEEYVTTYELVLKNKVLNWSKLMEFVRRMRKKLGGKCLVPSNLGTKKYCLSLRKTNTPITELDPIERDDPVCKMDRQYRDILMTNDKDGVTDIRLKINPTQIIKRIIDQNNDRKMLTDIKTKIEEKANEILRGINDMRSSMGNYFLALATYDEAQAIVDLADTMDRVNEVQKKYIDTAKVVSRQLGEIVYVVFANTIVYVIEKIVKLAVITASSFIPMAGTGWQDVDEAMSGASAAVQSVAKASHLIVTLRKHNDETKIMKEKLKTNFEYMEKLSGALKDFQNEDLKDKSMKEIETKIKDLMSVYKGGLEDLDVAEYAGRISNLIDSVCGLMDDSFEFGYSSYVKSVLIAKGYCSPEGLLQMSLKIESALSDGADEQDTVVAKLMDIGRAFIAKQMALRIAQGTQQKRSEKQITRDIILMQIKDLSYERKRIYYACSYWEFSNFGKAPHPCKNKNKITDKKLKDLMDEKKQYSEVSCRAETPNEIYLPASLTGDPEEGVISLNDLKTTGATTLIIPKNESKADKYLQKYWFHGGFLKGTDYFVKEIQLFLPFYHSRKRRNKLKVTFKHGPAQFINGNSYIIKEKYKDNEGNEEEHNPYESSVVFGKVTKSCSIDQVETFRVKSARPTRTADTILPTIKGTWTVTLENNLPELRAKKYIDIPSDIMGTMYIRGTVTLCHEKISSGRKKREVTYGNDFDSCCKNKDDLYQYNKKEEMFSCQKCPAGSRLSKDGFYCQDIDECKKNPCQNEATCLNFHGKYNCVCKLGWAGKNCNKRKVISDMCTGEFQEDGSKARNGKRRPPPGTKCVGGCIEKSGRWGKNFCNTAEENWGAECVPCSV